MVILTLKTKADNESVMGINLLVSVDHNGRILEIKYMSTVINSQVLIKFFEGGLCIFLAIYPQRYLAYISMCRYAILLFKLSLMH